MPFLDVSDRVSRSCHQNGKLNEWTEGVKIATTTHAHRTLIDDGCECHQFFCFLQIDVEFLVLMCDGNKRGSFFFSLGCMEGSREWEAKYWHKLMRFFVFLLEWQTSVSTQAHSSANGFSVIALTMTMPIAYVYGARSTRFTYTQYLPWTDHHKQRSKCIHSVLHHTWNLEHQPSGMLVQLKYDDDHLFGPFMFVGFLFFVSSFLSDNKFSAAFAPFSRSFAHSLARYYCWVFGYYVH